MERNLYGRAAFSYVITVWIGVCLHVRNFKRIQYTDEGWYLSWSSDFSADHSSSDKNEKRIGQRLSGHGSSDGGTIKEKSENGNQSWHEDVVHNLIH